MIEQVILPFDFESVKPFCDCYFPNPLDIRRENIHQIVTCKCGEEDVSDDWDWEPNSQSESFINAKNITFHPTYSTGTAIVRGIKPLEKKMIHFWEIRILTQLSGTDQVCIQY